MAVRTFLPSTDDGLLAWGNNFVEQGTPIATAVGLTTAQMTTFAGLTSSFGTAMAAVVPGLRNRAAVQTKNDARKLLVANARMLAKIIDGHPGVTNAQRSTLGLTVRSAPSPIGVPTDPPSLTIKRVVGRTVTVQLRALGSDKRAKPKGVSSAYVFTYVGATPPADKDLFRFEGGVTRTNFDIQFPSSVAGGAQVWVAACWTNPRDQTGPACVPVTCYLQGGGAVTAA